MILCTYICAYDDGTGARLLTSIQTSVNGGGSFLKGPEKNPFVWEASKLVRETR